MIQNQKNSNSNHTSGCLNYAQDTQGTAEYFLRSPSAAATTNYVLFTLSGVSFALNPHITQRDLSAKNDFHVRLVVIAIFLTTFVTMTPGILTGIWHISNKPDMDPEYATAKAFPAMLAVFRDKGGFSAFISYIALLAGIAGIMSTADSALIGVSNTMSGRVESCTIIACNCINAITRAIACNYRATFVHPCQLIYLKIGFLRVIMIHV